MTALDRQIAARRNDPAFRARIARHVAENAVVLARLADGAVGRRGRIA